MYNKKPESKFTIYFLSISILVVAVLILLNMFLFSNLGQTLDPISKTAEQSFEDMNEVKSELNTEKKKLKFNKNVLKIKKILNSIKQLRNNANLMDFAYLIAYESRKYGLDPYLVLAVIKTESAFRNFSVSDKGALGLMQVMPSTAFYVSEKDDDIDIKHKKELFDPLTNTKIGISYLAYLVKKYNNIKHALVAYNMGPGNLNNILNKKGNIPVVYYKKVMENYGKIIKM